MIVVDVSFWSPMGADCNARRRLFLSSNDRPVLTTRGPLYWAKYVVIEDFQVWYLKGADCDAK